MAFEQSIGSAVPPRESQFQLSDLLAVARERKRLIINVTLAVVAATLVVLMLLPTLYSSSAVVMLEPRKNNVTDASSVLSAMPTDPASIQNQILILTSRDIAERVIDKLGLMNDPEFNHALAPGLLSSFTAPPTQAAVRDSVIDNFLNHLSVDSLGLSTTIAVTFNSRDPQKAARIANEVADAYIADQVNVKFQAAQQTTQWLTDRIAQLAKQVQVADAAAERYRAEHNLTQTGVGGSLIDQQVAAISTQLVAARADLAEKQATLTRVQQLVRSGHAGDVSQVVASPLIVQLRTQEADLISQQAQMATKYGPRYPKMIAVQQQQRDLEAKVAEEVTRIGGSIANDVAVARAQVQSLQSSLQQAESQATEQNMASVELKSLEANATSTRTMYEAFVSRLRGTQDENTLPSSDARVISRAAVPAAPSSPKRTMIAVASVPAGVMLGLLIALLAEKLSGAGAAPVRRVVDFFRGLVVVADIPGASSMQAANAVVDRPRGVFAQAVSELANEIARSSTKPKVIAVTSAQAGEGATTIAIALARAASRMGLRVAMIDGDLGHANAARFMGVNGAHAALTDVLAGIAPLSRAFQRDVRSGALVLCGSHHRIDPAAVFASPRMGQLLSHLRNSCDLVIVDTPAVLGSNIAPAIAAVSDGVLMVVRQPREAAGSAIDRLRQGRSAPIGIVLAH
ncbi:MAG TPA: polysaccharide biosynthesis tyrosine autokinase [Rhizomicrobium sp.]|jgi:uncharacterized protein involved in exopolysaccharide biosynthesis|nr:polysaccharide biosynthesis tyrosine autokinase [Rhizomicrobium sp.]